MCQDGSGEFLIIVTDAGYSWKHGLWPAARGNYNVWRLLIWTGAIFIIIIFLDFEIKERMLYAKQTVRSEEKREYG